MARKKPVSITETADESLHEQIAALAHALWRERGCPEGSPEEDWFQAEQQIEEARQTELVKVVRRARRAVPRS